MSANDTPGSGAAPDRAGHSMHATLTVDLGRIAGNFRLLQSRAPKSRIGAVVKADAYGLGLDAIAPALFACGCRDFFVADAEEGLALRRLLADAPIFVLNGPAPESLSDFARRRLIPVLNDLRQIELWAGFARGNANLPAALHVDTGMTRLGLPAPELEVLAREPERLGGLTLACIMSHLACADETSNPINARQLADFRAALARLPRAPASLANSAGVFLGPDYQFDLVRAGGALYGLAPLEARPNPMAQVLRLQAPILQVRDVDSPMTVGYGASFHVAKRGRIATIPVGYADGFLRSLSNKGSAFLGGIRIPVVGIVSMDLTTLDVSAVPESVARPGAAVELIGDSHTVDDMAEEAGSIGHAVLAGFGRRIVRRYENLPG
jgi:alanine racemase